MPEGVGMPSTDDAMNKLPPKLGETSGDVPAGAKEEGEPAKAPEIKKGPQAGDDEIIRRAVKRFKRSADAESENRGKALEDLKFKAGDQWDAKDQADRNSAKRPCLIVNKLPTLCHQISNDIRQNRPAINVSPLGDEATKESAEMFSSFLRAIERDCAADIAYDTGVGSAIDIGFGYWRVLTEYENAESMDQVLVLRRVRNPFTVLLDYARQEPDGSDSRFGFVSEMVDRTDFTDQWPDANPISWDEKTIGTSFEPWATKDQVRVAEYVEVEHEHRRLVRLDTGHVGYYDELDEDVKKAISSGQRIILDERDAEVQKVMWYRLTSKEILERQRWPGKWIPIVEVLGEEIDIEGKVIRSGVIRPAKDPQRMKNYWTTTKTELYGLQPKAPWTAPEGSFEGYEDEWDRANRENVTRLEYVQQYSEAGLPLPGPQRQQPPGIAAGIVEAEKSAEQDMMGTTGVRFDSTTAERTYDESGKALRELRRSTDIGSFHYTDNFGRSLRHTGRILLDLIPKVYNRRRMVPVVAEDGKESRIMVDPSAPRPVGKVRAPQPNQEPVKVLNPTMGQYGVTVTIGPSYATKRIEAQEQMDRFLPTVPEPMRGVVAALRAKYSDWPGSTELFKAFAKMLPPGALVSDQTNLPPEVSALVGSLQEQLKAMGAERAQMIRDLTEKNTEFRLAKEKIDRDFESKVMKILAESMSKMDAQAARVEDGFQKNVGARLAELTKQVEMMLKTPAAPPAAPAAPAVVNVHNPRPPMGRRVTKRDQQGRAETIEEFILNTAAPAPAAAPSAGRSA